MRIEQLQAFLAVAQTGSFGKAAKQCSVTQSTVSRQILSLEEDLGLPLFHRSTRAKLTVAGEQLLPRARKICQEWQLASQEISDLKLGKQPEFCIAAIHSVCAYYLPPLLPQFCHSYPEVQLRVTALGSDRALKVLRDGLVDVAIVMDNRFLTTSPEMVVEVLYEEKIEVLMAADHPLVQYEQIPWSALIQYPQAIFKDGYGMQRLVQELSNRDQRLQIAMELNTLDAFRGVVRQGKIVAMLPHSALLEALQDPSLAIRPIAPDSFMEENGLLRRQVVMVTTSDRLQIPPIKYFCQLVQQQVQPQSLSLHPKTAKTVVVNSVVAQG